jgi:hypothetical protein
VLIAAYCEVLSWYVRVCTVRRSYEMAGSHHHFSLRAQSQQHRSLLKSKSGAMAMGTKLHMEHCGMMPIIATILFAALSFLVGFDSTIGPSSAHAFVAPMSPSQPRMKMASSSSSSSAAAAANRNVLPYPPPPPPHMSMPVWSFSCPISYATTSRLERRQLASSSSMSILTFVTPGTPYYIYLVSNLYSLQLPHCLSRKP